jgi:hypothetical protein
MAQPRMRPTSLSTAGPARYPNGMALRLAAAVLLSCPALALAQTTAQPLVFEDIGAAPKCSGPFVEHFYERPKSDNSIRREFHPVELELFIDDGVPVTGPANAVGPVRDQLRAFAAAEAAKPASKEKLTPFEARFLYCRFERLGQRANLFAKLDQLQASEKSKNASAAYWSGFIHSELSAYAAESAALPAAKPVDYKKLYGALAARSAAKLDTFVKTATVEPDAPKSTTTATTTAAASTPASLSDADRRTLPAKLLADYFTERSQASKAFANDPARLAGELNAITEKYQRAAADIRQKFGDADSPDRKAFADKINAGKDLQSRRDLLVSVFPDLGTKSLASAQRAKDQLQCVADQMGKNGGDGCIDGNARSGGVTVTAGGGSKPDARTQSEKDAEAKARQARNQGENEKRAISGEVPDIQGVSMDTDGAKKVDPDAAKKKAANARDTIMGAKLGLWGAILGALLFGPAGLILLGAAAFGAGFMMNRITNDGV